MDHTGDLGAAPPAIEVGSVQLTRPAVPTTRALTVFQSYSRQRDVFVDETGDLLRSLGYSIQRDIDFMAAGGVIEQIGPAVRRSGVLVAFCTREANESEFCRLENKLAFHKKIPRVPILIDPLEQMDFFETLYAGEHYIDVSSEQFSDYDTAWRYISLMLPRMLANGRLSNF